MLPSEKRDCAAPLDIETRFIKNFLKTDSIGDDFRKHIADLQKTIQNEDLKFLLETLSLRTQCIVKETAFEVGAILKLKNGKIYTGYSRENGTNYHAEEVAIRKAEAAWETKETIAWATIYSSLEPCTKRDTSPVWCTALIIEYDIAKIVIAEMEDTSFKICEWKKQLTKAKREFVHFPIIPVGYHTKTKKMFAKRQSKQ